MDLRKLKTLIDLVSESNVSELEITEAEGKVRIVKAGVPPAGAPILARLRATNQDRFMRGDARVVDIAGAADEAAVRGTPRPAATCCRCGPRTAPGRRAAASSGVRH